MVPLFLSRQRNNIRKEKKEMKKEHCGNIDLENQEKIKKGAWFRCFCPGNVMILEKKRKK